MTTGPLINLQGGAGKPGSYGPIYVPAKDEAQAALQRAGRKLRDAGVPQPMGPALFTNPLATNPFGPTPPSFKGISIGEAARNLNQPLVTPEDVARLPSWMQPVGSAARELTSIPQAALLAASGGGSIIPSLAGVFAGQEAAKRIPETAPLPVRVGVPLLAGLAGGVGAIAGGKALRSAAPVVREAAVRAALSDTLHGKAPVALARGEKDVLKESWQMTQEEFFNTAEGKPSPSRPINVAHHRSVEQAVSDGKPVPYRVVKQYPDIVARMSPLEYVKSAYPNAESADAFPSLAKEHAAIAKEANKPLPGQTKMRIGGFEDEHGIGSGQPNISSSVAQNTEKTPVIGQVEPPAVTPKETAPAVSPQASKRARPALRKEAAQKAAKPISLPASESAVAKPAVPVDVSTGRARAAQGPISPTAAAELPSNPPPSKSPQPSVASGAPPVVPPKTPPVATGVVPPSSGVPPVAKQVPGTGPEITRSLNQAAAMVKQDKPGAISALIDRAPGVGKLRNMERPGRTMPDNILGAHIAETSTRAENMMDAFRTRIPLVTKLENAFGKGTATGQGQQVPGFRFLGTAADERKGLTGTLYDMAQRPHLYELTDAQKQVLAEMESRNTARLSAVNKGYGTEIGQYPAPVGGAHLPNVDISEDTVKAIEALHGSPGDVRATASGRGKTRYYATAADRMAADETFVPNTNVSELLRGMDSAKASAASGNVFRAGVGGKTLEEVMSELHPKLPKKYWETANKHGYTRVELGGADRYFPAEEAAIINKLREPERGGIVRFLADWQATVLGGDFSPITIQGGQQALFHPISTARAISEGKLAFTPESLAKIIAADPQNARDFAFSTGRSLSETTPGEFGTGFIGRIPKVGSAISEANTRMYNMVRSAELNQFKADVMDLEKSGISHADAIAQAGDLAQRIVPETNPTRYGLSPAQAQMRRLPFTSISFIRKSGELLMDATRGYAKIAAAHPSSMTPKESLAVSRVTRAAALATSLSVTSAVLEAKRTGADPMQAARDAIDPGSPRFLSLVIAGHRAPIGGPLRALFAAMVPQKVTGVPVPVPFGGMPRYLSNRIQPGISTALHIYKNADFVGHPVFKPTDTAVKTALKLSEYAMESLLPTTAGQVAGDVRRGNAGPETAIQAAGQLSGQNVNPLYNKSEVKPRATPVLRPSFPATTPSSEGVKRARPVLRKAVGQ